MKQGTFKKPTYAEALEKLQRRKVLKMQKKPHQRPKIKRSKIKKPKRLSVSRLHKLVWIECRRIASKTLEKNCYTCPARNLEGSNCQLGHGQNKGSLPLRYKYDLRNLKWQCFSCNIHNQGRQELFLARLENEISGREFLNESSFKNENGGWEIKKLPPIDAWMFLAELLSRLKLVQS